VFAGFHLFAIRKDKKIKKETTEIYMEG